MAKTTKSRISAILPHFLVVELKKAAHQENTSQSAVLQEALELWMKKKIESDAKELSEMDFSDIGSEQEWFDIQTETLKQ